MTEYPEPSGKQQSLPPAAPLPGQPSPYSYPPGPPPGPYAGGYPPPPMPYGGDYYPAAPVPLRNGLGVAALVVAIIALISSFSIAGGIVLGIAAVILGFLGRSRVKRGEANTGGVALAGIILGVIAIIVGLIFVAIWVGLFKEVGAGDYFDCLQQAGQDKTKVQMCSDEFRQSVSNKFSETGAPAK
ncbi:MAG: DUF4190 domain-containing protein [Mycobacterium sp.]